MTKYTTTLGTEVEVKPVGLTDRDGWLALKNLQASFKDDPSWKERLQMHEDFIKICEHCGIPADTVGEGDIINIYSILQVGETPKNSKTPQ